MYLNKEKCKKIFLYTFLIYFSFVGALYLIQRSMVFFPDKNVPDISGYLEDGFSELQTQTSDGLVLSGWSKSPDLKKETIVFFHGNASHHGMRIYKAGPYAKAGYGIVLAGYRGYGGNPGKPSEQGFYKDARAWMDKLIADGIALENIVVYGESIGTGVAVQMALEYPQIKALVLESPYTSLPDVAAGTYFFIPVHLLMKDKFDSLSKIKDIKTPVLIIQGLKDQVVSAGLGQKLYEAANQPKDILQLENYGHNDMPHSAMFNKVMPFIRAN